MPRAKDPYIAMQRIILASFKRSPWYVRLLVTAFVAIWIGCLTPTLRPKSTSWRVKPGSVYDGDTFRAISTTGKELKVRLACIDTPELKQSGGQQARDYLRSILSDNRVIKLKVRDQDRYKRAVAEVYVQDHNLKTKNVNSQMVCSGMAHFYATYAKSCPELASHYAQCERNAQRDRIGIWRSRRVVRPWEWRSGEG